MAKLVSRLPILAEQVGPAVELAIQDAANFILDLIRASTPVDTGFLRDSYQKEQLGYLHVLIGTMVNYSAHVEFGTSRQAAQPHFVPAFVGANQYFQAKLKERLKDLG